MDLEFINEYLISTFILLVGLCLGSFANVIIYRWPLKKSFVTPRSSCPHCETSIHWYQNIPVFSWIFLKGQSACCQKKISFRYPLVEALTGSLFLISYHVIGPSWFLIEFLYFIFALVVVSFIDFDHYLLPDLFTLSGIVIGLIGALLNPEREFIEALIGVFLGGGFLWMLAFLYFAIKKQEGMGGGDIKLLAWIGAVLGWKALPFVILFSSLSGALVGIFMLLKKNSNMQTALPFGPYLAAGAVLFCLLGDRLVHLYIEAFFL